MCQAAAVVTAVVAVQQGDVMVCIDLMSLKRIMYTQNTLPA